MSRKKCRDFTTKMEIFGANSVHVRKLCSEFGQIFMGCASLNAHNLWAETHQSSWEGFLCFRLERGRSQFWEEIHLSSYAITHQSCEEKCPKTNTIRSTLHLYWLKEDPCQILALHGCLGVFILLLCNINDCSHLFSYFTLKEINVMYKEMFSSIVNGQISTTSN